MRITQWGEYGVLCAVFLADKERNNCPTVGATEIAKAQGIALEYAQQILQRLRRGGIISSVRGPQGGYKLARAADEITLRDILLAAEGDTFEVICESRPLSLEQCRAQEPDCGLKELWRGLKIHVDDFLNEHKLQDLVGRINAACLHPADHGVVQINSKVC